MLFTATGEVGEVKPVFDDAGAGRVMEFDSDRVTGALVADHPDIIRVLQADPGLASRTVVATHSCADGGKIQTPA